MEFHLKHYKNFQFDGDLYAYCTGGLKDLKKIKFIEYSLNTVEGKTLQTLQVEGAEEGAFLNVTTGKYTLKARISLKDSGQQEREQSLEIKEEDAKRDLDSLFSHSKMWKELMREPANEKLRLAASKAPELNSLKGHLKMEEGFPHVLTVKFEKEGLNFLKKEESSKVPFFFSVKDKIRFIPFFAAEKLGQKQGKLAVLQTLAGLHTVESGLSSRELLSLAQELEKLSYVSYCSLSVPSFTMEEKDHKPETFAHNLEDRSDIPTVPPCSDIPDLKLTPYQHYLNEGYGLNIRKAWDKGVTGKNIRVHIGDGGVLSDHESIKNKLLVITENLQTSSFDHGAATSSIIGAEKADKGMTGIAYDSPLFFYANAYNPIPAITLNMRPGDIILLNQQTSDLLPITSYPHYADAIHTWIQAGAVVVMAAGNGRSNILENPKFEDFGDLGAIAVGAIDIPSLSREESKGRIASNYNYYSIMNAWGNSVVSAGMGGWCGNTPQTRYTASFPQTSAATPQVAGALTLVQSYVKEKFNTYLGVRTLYTILSAVGYTENTVGEQIGTRPNVARTLELIDGMHF